jgi:hypothetical protein
MKEANKESFKAARAEWKAWKEDWKEQYKLQRRAWKREHPGEKAVRTSSFYAASRRITAPTPPSSAPTVARCTWVGRSW